MKKCITVAVTGAAGQIGYALLFRIASGQMFGPDVDVKLQLLELKAALPALEGVAMELDDCAFPLLRSITCTADLNVAFNGVNTAVLVGSVPRSAGMERADLLKINGGIFIAQGRAINDNAADDVKTFVVGNPCNTNCLIAMHNAPDVPNDQFFAMTSLDELRAKTQLAQKAGMPVYDVKDMTIWGNHSSTQYPDFYNATIAGKPALDSLKDENWCQETFIPTVQKRGAAIIAARGASSAASAANAAVHGVYQLYHDTQDSYSMCLSAKGEYGVDKDLIFSFPCQTINGKVTVIEGIEHNDYGQAKFQATLDELRQERDTVKAMGLLDGKVEA